MRIKNINDYQPLPESPERLYRFGVENNAAVSVSYEFGGLVEPLIDEWLSKYDPIDLAFLLNQTLALKFAHVKICRGRRTKAG